MNIKITLLLLAFTSSLFANSQLKDAVKDYQITSIKLKFGTDKKDLVDSLSNLSYSINSLSDSEIKKIEAKLGLGFFDDLKSKLVIQQEFWGKVGDGSVYFKFSDGTAKFFSYGDYYKHYMAGELLPNIFHLYIYDREYEPINEDEVPVKSALSVIKQLYEKAELDDTKWYDAKEDIDNLVLAPELSEYLNYVKSRSSYNEGVVLKVSSNADQFLAIKDDVELLSKNLN